MKNIVAIIVAIALTGCADMTPREKYWTVVAIGVLAVGAVAVYRADHRGSAEDGRKSVQPVDCKTNPAACV